jgi:transposase
LKVTCGIDWSEKHHDVALVDADGTLVARRRVTDDVAGWKAPLELFAEHGDNPAEPIPVAIETGRDLLVTCLRATDRKIHAINPLSVARYRERHTVARSNSDHADAMTLTNIPRVDAAHHRPLPNDSELVQAIAVLARAQQDPVWNRQQLANQLRSPPREYFPAALTAFQAKGIGLTSREARAVLAAAPTPTTAAKLTKTQLRAASRRSGRQRDLDAWTDRLHALFREESLRQFPMVEAAFGTQTQALPLQLDAACQAADDLTETTAHTFHQHPHAATITSFPGLADLTGARVLAEIGDDRNRFAGARALKAYAGPAPITRASGKSTVVHHRKIKNQRLPAAGYVWAFASLKSAGPRAHYDHRRQVGDQHSSALRNTFSRMLDRLFHCLQTSQHHDESAAFGPRLAAAA